MDGDDPRQRAQTIARSLWQGDLINTSVAVVLETPEYPQDEEAAALESVGPSGIWAPAAQEIESGWAAIVTQTCDVVRDIDDVTYLQMMPVVALSQLDWDHGINGRRGGYFSLPPVEGLNVECPAIDCAISFPVTKSALAHEQARTLSTSLDPAARVLLSHWLMRRVGRYAFPDELEQYVLAPLREKVSKATGKNSLGGFLASSLIGVWSSTEWAPAVSIIFVVDENRLYAEGKDIDLDKAIAELLASARKHLGKTGISVQITASARTLSGVSAFDLLVAHRQVDMDVLPVGSYAAKDTILALAAAGGTKPRAAPQ